MKSATRSPMTGLRPPGFRSRRFEDRRRRRVLSKVAVVALVVLLMAGGVYVFARSGSQQQASGRGMTPGPSTMLVLVVRGTVPLAAVIGSQGTPFPAAVSLPSDTTYMVPGQGEAEVAESALLSGETFRVATSNMMGAWAQHYAVMDREGLAAIVDRMAGLEVDLSESVELSTGAIGPGPTRMTGARVQEYLAIEGPNLEFRWETMLEALLRQRVPLLPSDLLETDDALAATAVLEDAQEATIESIPTVTLGGDPEDPLVQVDREALPEVMRTVFGYTGEPVPVIVINGAGIPGVGESVAQRIVPAGFRVVISQNADSFGQGVTLVIAAGEEHLGSAGDVAAALGVGEVQVSQVPSGLADVTVVVGKDYKETTTATIDDGDV